ncbi:hypothetical protein [Pararhodobacter sp.]|uniref:hypothetical protein n=1 Tax=Pararhodobacter sp. TaxID=2127056 RepID=UPI002AFFF4D7|nr:hypothetical protein [Pararhodobacter sp.]
MTLVHEFRPSERIIIDAARLEEVFRRLGDKGAEAFVMEAVEAISDLLAEVDGFVRTDVLTEIAPRAQLVSRISAEIGLTSLARVSRDMGIAASRDDVVAYRAVWERLVRIGDRSLSQVWELPGLSI